MLDMTGKTNSLSVSSSSSCPCPESIITCGHHIMDSCRDVIAQTWRKPLSIQMRDNGLPVTQVDYALETLMVSYIRELRPDDGVMAEEIGSIHPDAEYRWVLNPIDSTASFITGALDFAVTLACMHGDQFIFGMIDQPIAQDRWVGAAGYATTHNNERTKIRKDVAMDEALIACPQVPSLVAARLTVPSQTLSFGLLASGLLDAVVFDRCSLSDYAAGVAVVYGVGGTITDWQGTPVTPDYDGGPVVATVCEKFHKDLLAQLS